MIRKGEPWGEPADGDGTRRVHASGDDADLAAVVAANPGAPFGSRPPGAATSPGRWGYAARPTGNTVLACDAIELPDGCAPP